MAIPVSQGKPAALAVDLNAPLSASVTTTVLQGLFSQSSKRVLASWALFIVVKRW